MDLACQQYERRASKLVRAALPSHVEQGVEFVGDPEDRRGDNGAVEHDEEVDEGDRRIIRARLDPELFGCYSSSSCFFVGRPILSTSASVCDANFVSGDSGAELEIWSLAFS